PLYRPLAYQIPVPVLRSAMHASRMSESAFWSYRLYRGPNNAEIPVHYCTSKEQVERVASMFVGKEVLGFDIEWKPQASLQDGLKKNVSLMQLACEDRIALFHIALHKGDTAEDILAPTLRKILESPDVLKTGVAVKADCSRVERFFNIQIKGVFELSHLHNLVKYSRFDPRKVNKKLVSLAKQVEEHLQLPLAKGDVRISDWSHQLNHQQVVYAACDAYAGYRVFEALEEKRMAMNPRPPRPDCYALSIPSPKNKTVDESAQTPPMAQARTSAPAVKSETSPTTLDAHPLPSLSPTTSEPTPTDSNPSAFLAAEHWLTSFLTDLSSLPSPRKPRAPLSNLRAYAIWHLHPALSLEDVAATLRDPPLKTATVATYIMEAVKSESLPVDEKRLKEVL
ncbi:ribonuclease H-like protein, partial [Aulographum hederae CBS 113979]